MHTLNNHIKPRRQWPALLAAIGMTLLIGALIAALGFNALFNTNVVPVEAAPADPAPAGQQMTLDQMQSLINQYQDREAQYQQELQQATDQLNSANSQLTQYQNLINALQRAGVIQIAPDGRVFVFGGGGFRGENEGNGN